MENQTYTTHISDNHNDYNFLVGEGNILIHSGDATNGGTQKEVEKLNLFFEKCLTNFDHIVFTPGNHDLLFQSNETLARSMFSDKRINILLDQSVTLCGLKIYASPYSPKYKGSNWAFLEWPEKLNEIYSKIEKDANVLVTHGPPHEILDYTPTGGHLGNNYLTYLGEAGLMANLRLHCFGHIHECYGVKEKNNIIYSNAAISGTQARGPFSAIRYEWIGKEIVNYNLVEENKI